MKTTNFEALAASSPLNAQAGSQAPEDVVSQGASRASALKLNAWIRSVMNKAAADMVAKAKAAGIEVLEPGRGER